MYRNTCPDVFSQSSSDSRANSFPNSWAILVTNVDANTPAHGSSFSITYCITNTNTFYKSNTYSHTSAHFNTYASSHRPTNCSTYACASLHSWH